MADPVLSLRGVTKEYGVKVVTRVLHGIDLTIEAGEFAALIGPSGSGKSTLLNMMGLLDRPTSGQIIVAGQDTGAMADKELTNLRGRALGFVFQFHHLLSALTAIENVMVPMAAASGKMETQARARAIELLERVGLAEHMHKPATDLSGGQQQRVAIARALALSPPLVLADEPTGNLDTATADQVFELLREINRTQGTAFLVVTHAPTLAERCDRTIELVDGRIVRERMQ